ncbi:MAG: hypothetical protein IJQ58_07025, partial [Synergistaceae bacterium]|nr:hypothetical protein [Synergistaceae bacterium]
MNLLFGEGGSRCWADTEGNIYVASNFDRAVQERYKKFCDKFILLQRTDGRAYPFSELPRGLHLADRNITEVITVPDLYRPRSNFFSFGIRREIARVISEAIQKADKVIIRVGVNYYTTTAEKLCRKYHKPYLIEAVEFVFEANWYYGIEGKIIAPFSELKARRMIRRAPYVLYVSQHVQQERYPSLGKTLGCSDVELENLDNCVL